MLETFTSQPQQSNDDVNDHDSTFTPQPQQSNDVDDHDNYYESDSDDNDVDMTRISMVSMEHETTADIIIGVEEKANMEMLLMNMMVKIREVHLQMREYERDCMQM